MDISSKELKNNICGGKGGVKMKSKEKYMKHRFLFPKRPALFVFFGLHPKRKVMIAKIAMREFFMKNPLSSYCFWKLQTLHR